ncbi:MAG: radical SAM protein [Actinobacteria bacterium]|nr:radical SAM protein [Actinomycetota bacterium]
MVVCEQCERRCLINEGDTGYCRMYVNRGGALEQAFKNMISALMIQRIEGLPVFHFYPGSRTLSFSTTGCNFDCRYCSTAFISRSDPAGIVMHELDPEIVVRKALLSGCHNIAFTTNEPTVSLAYLLELADAAHEKGLNAGCLTNGYQTPAAAEALAGKMDFMNVSLKGSTDGFYRDYVGVDNISPVLRNLEYYSSRVHLEITTPVISEVNDDQIGDIASMIGNINREIPWHVFRLLPEYKMADREYPDINDLAVKLEDARSAVDYIYFGNFPGSEWVSTDCPSCGTRLIERVGLGGCGVKPVNFADKNGLCPECGTNIALTGNCVDYNSAEIEGERICQVKSE